MKINILLFLLISFSFSKSNSQNQKVDSTENGKFVRVEKNELKLYGYYKNSKRHKIWTWYNTDGTLNKQIKYKKDKIVWVLYFENNKAWLKINRKGKRKIIRACNCREQDY
ncbi:MAG: hypothetical protein IT243_05400 [Bacteroidia bacterium]|nr:hypothetical protein [Bacteroidia bacterium]